MTIIEHETRIAAPAMRVFLLSLSIDLHRDSALQTNERAIEGVTQGLIGLGETVTWRGRHFGFMLEHETIIAQYDAPRFFEDAMVRGMFKSFRHQHTFDERSGLTLMRDRLEFSAPLGPLGWFAERLFLRAHLDAFVRVRNQTIKQIAESGGWKNYLHAV